VTLGIANYINKIRLIKRVLASGFSIIKDIITYINLVFTFIVIRPLGTFNTYFLNKCNAFTLLECNLYSLGLDNFISKLTSVLVQSQITSHSRMAYASRE
jgi:hypothetical protein